MKVSPFAPNVPQIIGMDSGAEDNETLTILQLCRDGDWSEILACVKKDPQIAMKIITMNNNISTTILHQAITSKADTGIRACVISTILKLSPEAAAIRNGYGSLPLHVISQRNTKMDSETKERLIHELVKVYPQALNQEGGVGKRTPLHIAFTDYISPELARMMINAGKEAAFKQDRKGWLPIHVAVSRHCSPEKLSMLLEVHPKSLYAKTLKGESLLMLAKKCATKSHPNFRLISELEDRLSNTNEGEVTTLSLQQDGKEAFQVHNKSEAANLLLSLSRQDRPPVADRSVREVEYTNRTPYTIRPPRFMMPQFHYNSRVHIYPNRRMFIPYRDIPSVRQWRPETNFYSNNQIVFYTTQSTYTPDNSGTGDNSQV
jgi:hypothetical protein